MIDGDSVLERVRAAGVRGDVAADGASALARGIWGVVIAGTGKMAVEVAVDNSGFDDRVGVAKIDFEDFAHAREDDHHATADRHATAGEAGACATRHERHFTADADFHDLSDLGRRPWEDNDRRAVFLDDEGVAFVD